MPTSLRDHYKNSLSLPKSARIILAAAAISLIFAFAMQFGFGYQPCVLCLWQRIPFVAAIVFAGLALAPNLRAHAPVLLALCALAFFIGVGLAVFHTGVERHWWLGTEGCRIKPLSGNSVEDIREQLLSTPVAHCDEMSWTLFGFSMANYNVIWSLLLALFALCAAKRAAQ